MAGCTQQFRINEIDLSLVGRESHRVDSNGCPVEVASGIRFTGEGQVDLSLDESNLYNISFNFRTTQISALLMQAGNLSVSLFHSRIKLQVYNAGIQYNIVSMESNLGNNIPQFVSLQLKSSNSQST